MDKGYDNVSAFYDRLSRLVFGRQLEEAQQWLLSFIPANATILIVGGGSGWIIDALSGQFLSGLNITYVDASPKMIAIAQKRFAGENTIRFIAEPIENVSFQEKFDIILTPFFFDNFTDARAASIFSSLHKVLGKDGLWLYTDFQRSASLKHRLLLKAMYYFFSVLCNIRTRKLPDMAVCFEAGNYVKVEECSFMNGFVSSLVYMVYTNDR